MKGIPLIILFFSFKILNAQSFYIGGGGGGAFYNFRQVPYFNTGGVPLDFTCQAMFKGDLLGMDIDIMLEPVTPFLKISDATGIPPVGGYIVSVNGLLNSYYYSNDFILRPKFGGFYTDYLGVLTPFYDWGPTVGVFAGYKVGKDTFLGLDLTGMFGVNNYFVATGSYYDPHGYTRINYYNALIKMIYNMQ